MKDRGSERVEFINLDGSGQQVFDLSASGIALLYPVARAKGDLLSVEIGDLSLKAKVVYSQERTDGFRLGLQFMNVAVADQKELFDAVEKFSKGVPVSCRVTAGEKEKA